MSPGQLPSGRAPEARQEAQSERKQEKCTALPLEQGRKKRHPVLAGPVAAPALPTRRPPPDWRGDQLARQLREDEGEDEEARPFVNHVGPPKRQPSLAGAAALPVPPPEVQTEAG